MISRSVLVVAVLALMAWPAQNAFGRPQLRPAQEAPAEESRPAAPLDEAEKPAQSLAKAETPEILRDLNALPFAARRMHELLIEAAKSGDIEKLRQFVGSGDDVTLFSFGGVDGDPIEFLKSLSGDDEGHEILAILLEVLEAGFVRLDAGTEQEMFVWPYFAAVPSQKLTGPQKVELYTILTHGDFLEMQEFGSYVFYRAGITPAGRWRFFVAGE